MSLEDSISVKSNSRLICVEYNNKSKVFDTDLNLIFEQNKLFIDKGKVFNFENNKF